MFNWTREQFHHCCKCHHNYQIGDTNQCQHKSTLEAYLDGDVELKHNECDKCSQSHKLLSDYSELGPNQYLTKCFDAIHELN